MTPLGDEAFEVLRDLYCYDETIPLDTRVVERLRDGDGVREKIVFRVGDRRVPAYLAHTGQPGSQRPCVLLLHGIGGSKEGWWRVAVPGAGPPLLRRLIARGYAVLALDCVYHGERLAENDYESPEALLFERSWTYRVRDMVIQSVVEHRRALDMLSTREEVDCTRVGMVGYSMGGMMTFVLAAIEPRITACVACVPPVIKEPYSAIAMDAFAPRIQRPFLLQVGTDDAFNYSTEDVHRLHAQIASQTKELVFHDGGHDLPDEWRQRAVAWLEDYLR